MQSKVAKLPIAITESSIDHRLCKAEAHFNLHRRAFSSAGSIASKLRSWVRGPATSALYGSSNWHVSQTSLLRIKRWEFGLLRRALRMRAKPGEGSMLNNQRTAKQLQSWFRTNGCWMLHHRVLREVFLNAWREHQHEYPDGKMHF